MGTAGLQSGVDKKKIDQFGVATLIFMFMFQFINVSDKMIIGVVAVPAMKDLNLNPAQWGLVGSAFYWLYSVFSILGGGWGDRFGLKKIVSAMAAVWSIVQYATLFVLRLPMLIVTRVVLGAAEGPNQAATMSMVGRFVPKEKLGLGSAITVLGGNIGSIVMAPVIVAVMVAFGWKAAFVVTGTLGLIWLVFWLIFGKDRHPSLETTGAQEAKNKGKWADALPSMLNKNFILLCLCSFCHYWFWAMVSSWVPAYLKLGVGISEGYISIVMLIGVVMMFAISSLSDYILKRTHDIKRSRVNVLGICLIVGGVFFYALTYTKSPILSILVLSFAFLGEMFITLGPTTILATMSAEHSGKAIGTATGIGTIASILSPLVTGIIINGADTKLGGFNKAFFVVAVMDVVVGIATLVLFRLPKSSAGVGSTGEVPAGN